MSRGFVTSLEFPVPIALSDRDLLAGGARRPHPAWNRHIVWDSKAERLIRARSDRAAVLEYAERDPAFKVLVLTTFAGAPRVEPAGPGPKGPLVG